MDRQLTTSELRRLKPNRKEYPLLAKYPISVLLDNLKSGYNLGSILRVAEALMLETVYLCGEIPQVTGKRARKTAVGAEKWIRTQRCPSAFEQQGLSLKRQGYHLVAVELTEKSQDYRKVEYLFPAAFVLGSELNGVSEKVLSIVDQAVHLPIYGMANSLNVSSAASVILYDAVKQLRLPSVHERQNKNRIYTYEFSHLNTKHEYNTKIERHKSIACQCGGCSFFAPFNKDWGLCCFVKSRHFLETIFEHFGCTHHVDEGWGPHSFQEDREPFRRRITAVNGSR